LLSEHVFGEGFANDLSTFLVDNCSELLHSWHGKPLAHGLPSEEASWYLGNLGASAKKNKNFTTFF